MRHGMKALAAAMFLFAAIDANARPITWLFQATYSTGMFGELHPHDLVPPTLPWQDGVTYDGRLTWDPDSATLGSLGPTSFDDSDLRIAVDSFYGIVEMTGGGGGVYGNSLGLNLYPWHAGPYAALEYGDTGVGLMCAGGFSSFDAALKLDCPDDLLSGGFGGGPVYLPFTFDGPGYNALAVYGVTMSNFRRVPEPATLALLGLGIACLGFACRRKRQSMTIGGW